MVTDGAGNVGWAPRLAYSYSEYVNFEQDGDLTPEFSFYSFDGMFNRWYDDFNYSLKENAEYVVVFDGEEYWCTPISYRDSEMGYTATVLGNASLIKEGSSMAPIIKDDTGEPFVFYTYQNGGSHMTFLEASTDGEHTISIRTAEETASPFDPKYLPDSAKALIVVIDMDDSDNYVASATYQEIADAITAGRYVMCVYGTEAFQLVTSPVLSDIAPMISLPTHAFLNVGDAGTYATLKWIFIESDNGVRFTTKKLKFDT